MLISTVQQSDSVIHIFHILFHCGLSQDIEYSSLCYTVGTFCLSILFVFLNKSLLDYNCFTILCLLVSVAQQSESAICIHMSPYALPLEPPSHPPYPTPLGHHKAPS